MVVLFADISDSSRLYRELGDAKASALVVDLLAQLATIVNGQAGQVVDQIGDELMCSFPDTAAAIRSAVKMQLSTRSFARSHPNGRNMAIRIGLHCGDGLEKDGKPVGDPVYIAKRLTDQAKGDQILMSEQSREKTAHEEFGFRFVEETTLKGQAEPTRIYELVWDMTDATELVTNDKTSTQPIAVGLELLTPHHLRQSISDGHSITIGRATPAILVIDHTTVSRLHARIEGRKGRFVLTDMSTNGTFVQSSTDKEPNFVRRDDIGLVGFGMIGLGQAPSPGAPNTMQYRCITK